MSDLKRGSIVLAAYVPDENGINRKDRPVIVMNRDCSVDRLFVVSITSTFSEPLPPQKVSLRWQNGGHPVTGLDRECVAVCSWYHQIDRVDIRKTIGFCGDAALMAILEQLKLILEAKKSG